MTRLQQLIRQAFAQGTGNQTRDYIGTRYGNNEGKKKIRKNDLEADAHAEPFSQPEQIFCIIKKGTLETG
jgi:hypothetical protein